MNRKRYIYIDYLKVLGLLLVILAHVNCPSPLMQVRSFDVPLLVFVSGILVTMQKGIIGSELRDLFFQHGFF